MSASWSTTSSAMSTATPTTSRQTTPGTTWPPATTTSSATIRTAPGPGGVALLDGAIAGLDSLDTTISFLLPLPARDVLLVRVFEAAVHTWDVSRAIGFDERIDERLAMLTCPLLERLIQGPATQAFFGPPQGTLPSTATPQDRLLHLAGRKP